MLKVKNTSPHDQYIVNFQDYDVGGEEYLTFAGTRSNLGGGMDAKSGVFTVPQVCILYLYMVYVYCLYIV